MMTQESDRFLSGNKVNARLQDLAFQTTEPS